MHGRWWARPTLLLSEKREREPLVGLLLNNIVRYAQRVGWAVPTSTGKAVDAAHPTSSAALVSDALMARSRSGGWDVGDLAAVDRPDLSTYDLLWVNAGLAQAGLPALRSFVEQGGALVLSRLDPTVVTTWQPLIPFAVRLVASPRDIAYGGELKRKGDRALFDGISDYDLWWKRGSCPRGGPKGRITSIPVEFEISARSKSAAVTEILGRGAMLEASLGKGRVLLSQIRWEEAFDKEQRSLRMFNTLLHNLGISRTSRTAAQGKSEFVPLRVPTNRALAPGVLAKVGGRVRRMPTGRMALAGATFETAPEGPQLALLGAPKTVPDAPRRLTIPVGTNADRLWFWHSAAFGFIDYHHGKTVLEYRVNIKPGAASRTEAGARRRTGPWSIAQEKERFTQISDTGRVWAVLGPFDNRPHPHGGFAFDLKPHDEATCLSSSSTASHRPRSAAGQRSQPSPSAT